MTPRLSCLNFLPTHQEMKAMIYLAVEEAPSIDSVEEEVLKRHFANFDENFFLYCDQELKKINTFYSEKLAEATRKYAALSTELKEAIEMSQKSTKKSSQKGQIPQRKVQELKLAFSEFYLSLILLQNYQNLNYTGFRKILKKHDKLLRVDYGAKWRQEYVEISHFFTNKDIDKLINETESAVTTNLEGGDRQRAMKRLRVPPLGEQQSPWTTFKVGLFSGSFIVLFITVVLSGQLHFYISIVSFLPTHVNRYCFVRFFFYFHSPHSRLQSSDIRESESCIPPIPRSITYNRIHILNWCECLWLAFIWRQSRINIRIRST